MGSNTKGALLALLGFGIFASHDVIVKYLGATYSPYQIVFFNVLFGFPMILFMLMGDSTSDTIRPHHPWWSAIRVVAILISTICVFYAFSTLPLTQAYAILFAAPLLITLLSIPILGERIGFHRGFAVLLGLVGVMVVLRPGSAEFTLGHGAALLGVCGSALSMIIVRRIGREERNVVLLLLPMLGTFLVVGGFLPFNYKPMPIEDLGALGALSILGFLAVNCMIVAYKTGEAAVVAPMQYSQMLWATFYGYLLFNETPDQGTLIGAGIIIASGMYIVVRESTKNVSENTPVLRSRARVAAGTITDKPFQKKRVFGKRAKK